MVRSGDVEVGERKVETGSERTALWRVSVGRTGRL